MIIPADIQTTAGTNMRHVDFSTMDDNIWDVTHFITQPFVLSQIPQPLTHSHLSLLLRGIWGTMTDSCPDSTCWFCIMSIQHTQSLLHLVPWLAVRIRRAFNTTWTDVLLSRLSVAHTQNPHVDPLNLLEVHYYKRYVILLILSIPLVDLIELICRDTHLLTPYSSSSSSALHK